MTARSSRMAPATLTDGVSESPVPTTYVLNFMPNFLLATKEMYSVLKIVKLYHAPYQHLYIYIYECRESGSLYSIASWLYILHACTVLASS